MSSWSRAGRCCENFLYVFKAARRAARAADAAATPQLPLALTLWRANQPVSWRENLSLPGRPDPEAFTTSSVLLPTAGRGWLPLRHCPRRPEPVKGAFGVGFAADP
jgi:hypothetical protein